MVGVPRMREQVTLANPGNSLGFKPHWSSHQPPPSPIPGDRARGGGALYGTSRSCRVQLGLCVPQMILALPPPPFFKTRRRGEVFFRTILFLDFSVR